MSTEDTELDEFFDKLGSETDDKKGHSHAQPDEGFVLGGDSSKKEEKPDVGKIVQYTYYGTGFQPCPGTIKTLPAGCYRPCTGSSGYWLNPANVVTDSLVQFPDTKSDLVISEIDHFWTLKDKFKQFGFSHKRGYLLWGPPGSGKSCTVAMVISKMVKKGGLVMLADHPKVLSNCLQQIRSAEPDREIVVIWEDIDTVIEMYGESEVLAVLDGESQIANVVFIATTNYPQRLDARITNRPSRFDRIEKIDMPNEEARGMYLMAKAGTTQAPDGTDLLKETDGMSIAHLRELIVGIWCQGSDPKIVLGRLKRMRVKPNSDSSGQPLGIVGNAKGETDHQAELKNLKKALTTNAHNKPYLRADGSNILGEAVVKTSRALGRPLNAKEVEGLKKEIDAVINEVNEITKKI